MQHSTGFSELDPVHCFCPNGHSRPLGRTRLLHSSNWSTIIDGCYHVCSSGKTYAFFPHKLEWKRSKKYLRSISIWEVFGCSSEFKVGLMVCMRFHRSIQLCLCERVVPVQAEESTETYRFKVCLWMGESCWFSETVYDKVWSLVSQLFFLCWVLRGHYWLEKSWVFCYFSWFLSRRKEWAALGNMSKQKAMTEFVKLLNRCCHLFSTYVTSHKIEKEEQEKKR